MPGLLTLHTDLKSLKYGHDRPGGGDSNQPYIVTDINNPTTPINVRSSIPIINQIATKDDGLIRGGVIGALNASATDALRISKFLYGDVKGRLFITKQIGLQLSNPLLETKKLNIGGGPFLNFIGTVTNDLIKEIGPTRVYNLLGAKTLAQVPVNAFGGHIVRHGLAAVNPDRYYIKVVADNNISGDNRLISLKNKFNLGNLQPQTIAVTSNRTQNVFKSVIKILGSIASAANQISSIFGGPRIPFLPNKSSTPDSLIISQYTGGPDSVYGIGSTTIRKYDDTSNPNVKNGFNFLEHSNQQSGQTRDSNGNIASVNYTTGLGKGSKNIISDYIAGDIDIDNPSLLEGINNTAVRYNNPVSKTYSDLRNQVENQQKLFNEDTSVVVANPNSGPNTLLFKRIYPNQFGIYKTERGESTSINKNSNYSSDKVDEITYKNPQYDDVVTIKFSDWSAISRENRIGSGRTDSINLTPLFTDSKYNYSDKKTLYGVTHNIRDLVKFCVQSVNTDFPDLSDFMIFRAYLTQFSDNVNATWNDVKYAGRGNSFYIYNGFTRKISIGFKVAALSEKEMAPMYSKLNNLIASLMPDYSRSVMRGPLHRLTVGNYLDAQLGILNSITYTIPNDSPWEIAIDEPEGGTKQLILPHIIEVSMDFTPIGADTQGKNLIEAKNKNTSFIAQNSTGKDKAQIQYYHDFLKKNIYKKDKANANTTNNSTNNADDLVKKLDNEEKDNALLESIRQDTTSYELKYGSTQPPQPSEE